jgi:hypothetical protein
MRGITNVSGETYLLCPKFAAVRNKGPASAFLGMTISTPASRDTRIDVFRALALITIYINHIPGTLYEHFTHRNIGFSDAAEAFVLISGVAVGLAYGMKFQPENRLLMSLKALRRTATLYLTHLVTTVATLAIFSAGAIWFARPELLVKINIEKVMTATPETMIGFVTLGHQLGYNNILPLYAALLAMVPLFLLIGSVSKRLLLLVSGLVWLASGIFRIGPPNYPNEGVWFLNPLSWQLLLVIGIVAVVHVIEPHDIVFAGPVQPGRHWLACCRVHAHIQFCIKAYGKASFRHIKLMGRNPQIRKDSINRYGFCRRIIP